MYQFVLLYDRGPRFVSSGGLLPHTQKFLVATFIHDTHLRVTSLGINEVCIVT